MTRFTSDGQFIYGGPYKTQDRAIAALEDAYATGEVCEGERPKVEHLRVAGGHDMTRRWFLTIKA